MGAPLAYHITFGTYGTRLHGDPRGTVDRSHNQPGEPIIGRDEHWEHFELDRLNFPPVFLTRDERSAAQRLIADVCARGGWRLQVCAAQADHVHTLLSAPPDRDPQVIRKLLKRWLHEALDAEFPSAIPRHPPSRAVSPSRAVRPSRAVPGAIDAKRRSEPGDIRFAVAPRSGGRPPGSDPAIIHAAPTWWAEGGSVRWVWDEVYFARVLQYIRDQRAA